MSAHVTHLVRPQTRSSAREGERGTITAFVVVLAAAFVVLAGLVYDGGSALAAKTAVIDQAQQAARTAATALNPAALRTGTVTLTPGQAIADAQAYLVACGDSGTVTISADQITVQAVRHQRTAILGVIGIGQITVTGTATAALEQGVTSPGIGYGS